MENEMEIGVNTGISILSGPREPQGLALQELTAGIRQRTPKSQQKLEELPPVASKP